MAVRDKLLPHVALALGLVAVACAQPPAEPDSDATANTVSDASAWIEGEVEDQSRARVIATQHGDPHTMVSAGINAEGRYRLGPLSPGEYELSVLTPFGDPAQVNNFAYTSVTAIEGTETRADFDEPGDGSVVVRFASDRQPGTMVIGIDLFDGAQDDVSMARYHELRRAQTRFRGRNTISAEDLTTTFNGLTSGTYTACAVNNVGGKDLRAVCRSVEVQDESRAEVTLDVRVG